MGAVSGIGLHRGRGGRVVAAALGGLLSVLVLLGGARPVPAAEAPGQPVSVIVRGLPQAADAAARVVEDLGGEVGRRIGIIDGFVAQVPEGRLDDLQRAPVVRSVTPDTQLRLQADGWDPGGDLGSLENTRQFIGAQALWGDGLTGRGVGVALIDSGVVPVAGMRDAVLHGPDLSTEGPSSELRYLDTYGHGTHMGAIIAGGDGAVGDEDAEGIAPDATLISVKVANASGATDVSQVIAAIDWVVEHRNDPGVNIRVLNLSFGTDGVQDYRLDPLAYAVEVAWRKGIVVVVAAGNTGFGDAELNNPAYDPYVIAVGASDHNGTRKTDDDVVAAFSALGDDTRRPDFLAPGRSVVALRDPGSYLDYRFPAARVGEHLFRGSGTSQSAAVVSGAAALLLQQRPELTPDEVKALLRSTAVRLPAADPAGQGAGLIDVKAAARAATPLLAEQDWPQALGSGSLEAARGSVHLSLGDVVLLGEQTVDGTLWDPIGWPLAAWDETSWSGGAWSGGAWSGGSWSGGSWSGGSWSGGSWSGGSWSGGSWSGGSWSGGSWSSASWGGA